MLNELEEKTRDIQGVVIEDNRFCISVHYRHVQEEVIKLGYIINILPQLHN